MIGQQMSDDVPPLLVRWIIPDWMLTSAETPMKDKTQPADPSADSPLIFRSSEAKRSLFGHSAFGKGLMKAPGIVLLVEQPHRVGICSFTDRTITYG